MGIVNVKAIELVFDWNIWPRHSVQRLDGTNIARMKEALRNGYPLPPPVVATDMRIVDGFHRVKARMSVFGDMSEIDVFMKEYPDDAAMVLEAGTLNWVHGLKMSPQDKAHFIIKCRSLKIPPAVIASALYTDTASMKEFLKKRTARTASGEQIALPRGAQALAGKKLTKAQEHFVRTATGTLPEMYAQMLINALRAEALMLTDKSIAKLEELRDLIDTVLEEV